MPRSAWNNQREREYQHLKRKFKKNDRYEGREEEVAARIVNKQRQQQGETRGQKARDRAGQSPDRTLPIDDYQGKTVDQIKRQLDELSAGEVRRIKTYEKQHKDRKTLITAIDKRLNA